ncbi:MAG: DUF2341 domain-containing protein [Thermoplasmata archaeon]
MRRETEMRFGGDSATQLSTAAKLAAGLLVGVFLLAAGLVFLFLPGPVDASSASSSWYSDTWSYRKRITIDATKVSADLSNFPVLIRLPSDDDLAADAQNDGDDILFTASNGTTTLNHEIERFNGTTGELVAWVNVTSLSSAADTDIFMYYGNATATNQESVAGTWDSDYVSVWHLDGTPPATMADSTGALDGTPANMDAADQVDGPVDGSLDFDGSNDEVSTAATTELDNAPAVTLEAWVKAGSQTEWASIVQKRNTTSTLVPSGLSVRASGVPRFSAWTSAFSYIESTTPLGNVWTHLVGVYDGTDLRLYVNGTLDTGPTGKTGNLVAATRPFYLGRNPFDAVTFNGGIDEVRVSAFARSADWIQTQYNNQKDTATFYSVGPEISIPELRNPGLVPASGDPSTSFNFTIEYASGNAPAAVKVNVSDATNGTYNNLTMMPIGTPEASFFVQEAWALNGSVLNFPAAQSSSDGGASALLTQEGGSIVLDTVSSDNTTSSPLTFSHTIGGGSHRLLVVLIGVEAPLGNSSISDVAYDGVSMTLAVQNLTGTTYDQRTAVYYLFDADLPPAGTYTVSVTASLAENIQAGAISVTGAAQQAPEATANSGDGQAGDDWIETQITTSTDGAWIFDVVGSGSPRTFTPNSGQTERFDVTGSSSGTAAGTKEVATAGTEVINWTTDGTSNRISHSLAAFAPAIPRLLIQFNTTGIRAGGEDILVLRYNLTSGDDAFGIWIWNFTASEWAQRGTIDRTVAGFFNYTLLPGEKSGGEVRMRFNDTSLSGSTDLSLDYQLVNNTLWRSGVTFYRNTTLAVGDYSHFFWARDSEGLENRTASFSGPTVIGLCDALAVVTSDPAGQLWFNESVEPDGLPYTTQLNVTASFQNAATPALRVTNDGSATCDIAIRLMSNPGSGRSLKFNTTNSAPWPTDATREVPLDPSSVTVCSAVAPGGTCDIWLWVDYENALAGQTFLAIRVESL